MCKNVKERLIYFIESQGLSKNAFESMVGLSKRYVSNIVSSVSTNTIEKIADKFPQLNSAWLLTGEGGMLKPQGANSVSVGSVSGNGNNFVAGNNNNIGTPRKEGVETIESEDVEIKETIILTPEIINQEGIDIKKELRAGTLDVEVKPTQDVIPPHEVKIYTENDEMSPEIDANDPIFARLIPSPKLFKPRYMYFVNLEYGGVVRWVVPEDEEHIRLISMKGEEVVPLSAVKSMFEVVAITKRPKTLPRHRATMSDVVRYKDAQIDAVNSQIDSMLANQSRLIGILEEQIKK